MSTDSNRDEFTELSQSVAAEDAPNTAREHMMTGNNDSVDLAEHPTVEV